MNQNALKQVSIECSREVLRGFSVSGLATYLQIAELDFCFDMGECPLSAVKLNHVALTHPHGDHHRCLMRHRNLRRMTGIEKEAAYYLDADLVESAHRYFQEEARFEMVSPYHYSPPLLIGIEEGAEPRELLYRNDLRISAFRLAHRIPTLGFTIYDFKKKLKDQFIGLPGEVLAEMRLKQGIEITREVLEPRITFLGDTTIAGIKKNPEIWKSRIVVLESTFIEEGEEEMAAQKGHTHLSEIASLLSEMDSDLKSEKIVLNHFSMKCNKKRIEERLDELFKGELREKVVALV